MANNGQVHALKRQIAKQGECIEEFGKNGKKEKEAVLASDPA